MTKKIKLLIISLIMIFCISVCILYKPIYYRLYLGNRIKGNVEVKIDDKTYFLEKNKINFQDSIYHDGTSKIYDDGTAKISFNAIDYGNYSFEILDTPIGSPVKITCFQHNWWSVQNFELKIEIDTSQNMITYSGNYTTILDNGKKRYKTIDKIQPVTDEYVGITLGY